MGEKGEDKRVEDEQSCGADVTRPAISFMLFERYEPYDRFKSVGLHDDT